MTAFGVVDLGFGDAGKGSVVDWLSRLHPGAVNIRFNGGPQAAHNVVTVDGRHHTFAQFGSGTFERSTTTYLSEFMMVDPLNMGTEADVLAHVGVDDAFERTTIHADARIVTPYHRAMNRLRELARGDQAHGSCGLGIGECASDAILNPLLILKAGHLRRSSGDVSDFLESVRQRFVRELMLLPEEPSGPVADRERAVLMTDVEARRHALSVAYIKFGQRVTISPEYPTRDSTLIFEGAQGVLLDEKHGFHPHTTWSDCTFNNMETLLARIGWTGPVERYGITRTYMTRHGAGPFPTESEIRIPEPHNVSVGWQGSWRQGWFDGPLIRYALSVAPVDGLIVTHQDSIRRRGQPVCTGYTSPDQDPSPFDPQNIWKYTPVLEHVGYNGYCQRLADLVGVPLTAVSYGPTADDKLVL